MDDEKRNDIDLMAEEFVERLRRGEVPAIEEYAERVPEHAAEIRELFPLLKVMERAAPDTPTNGANAFLTGKDAVPAKIGDYRILREVGRGGMGIVYEAEQISLGRHVAIKVLPDHGARNTKQLLRFRREARSAGRLHHTNIVPVFDVGCEEGIHYYTMQFIQGNNLNAVIAEVAGHHRGNPSPAATDPVATSASRMHEQSGQIARNLMTQVVACDSAGHDKMSATLSLIKAPGRVPTDAASPRMDDPGSGKSTPGFFRNIARIGMQVADALAYAHDQRILHRDIKPANLLLDIRGNVWVTDFGLAKNEDEQLTETGDIVGTLRFIAPERFKGRTDARSDIYSLGLTLYELLTLRSCVATQDSFVRNAPRKLLPPRAIDPLVPRDLETIVLKATAHEPQQRYARAEDMADDLRRFLAERPILARRTSWLETAWMACRRNPVLAVTALTAAVLLIVSCLGFALSHVLRSQRDLAVTAEESARAHEHLAKATSLIVSARPERRWRALEEIDQAVKLRSRRAVREALRDEAITALATTDVRVELLKWADVMPADTMDPNDAAKKLPHIAMSPNLRQVAISVPQRNKIFVVDVHQRRTIADFPLPDSNSYLRFSPSATFLIARPMVGQEYMTVWNIATGQRVFYAKEHWSYTVSPDDHWLAFGQQDGTVRLVDLRNPQSFKSFDAEGIPDQMAFSPDGKHIAVGYHGRARVVSIVNCETLEIEHRLATGDALYVSWHSDGSRLAVATGGRVQIWNVDDERRLAVTGDHLSMVDACEVLPGGELLLTKCWDGTSRLWDLHNMRQIVALETAVSTLPGQDDTVIGFRSVSDGIELVRVERSPFLFSLSTPGRPNEFPIAAQCTSNNLAVVTLGDRGHEGRELQLWDTSARRLLATAAVDQLSSAAFDSGAQRLTVVHGDEVSSLPVRSVGDSQLEIGPPLTFPLPGRPVQWSRISGDGLTIAMIIQGKLHVVRLRDVQPESTHGAARLDRVAEFDLPYPHDHLELSGNGHWAVTHAWHSRVICLWDLKRKELAREMQFGTFVSASFTPDSSQLVTSCGDAFRFLNLETMNPGLTLPRQGCPLPDPIAIDQGGRLAVARLQAGELQLVELPSGRILARLRRPQQDRAYTLSFNQGGTSFLEGHANGLDLWDLSALQEELRARGLDLVDHRLSAQQSPQHVESVKLIGMEGWAKPTFIGMLTETRARQRLEELEATLRDNPKSLNAANTLAWEMCMAPAVLRDADRAVELAESVVQRANTPTFRNTLAAAYYRQGEFQKAVTLLEENLSVSPDPDLPWDLLLLSLSHAALGHSQQAKDNLELTKRIMDIDIGGFPLVSGDNRAALDAFLQEAESAVR